MTEEWLEEESEGLDGVVGPESQRRARLRP